MICVSEGDVGGTGLDWCLFTHLSYCLVLSIASTIHDSIFYVVCRALTIKRSGFCMIVVSFPDEMIASFLLEGLAAEI